MNKQEIPANENIVDNGTPLATDAAAAEQNLASDVADNAQAVETEEDADFAFDGSMDECNDDEQDRQLASLTKSQLVEQLKLCLEKPIEEVRDEVPRLKNAFWALHRAEVEKLRADFIEQGGDATAFVAPDDAQEAEVKGILEEIKQRRAQYQQEQAALREANLTRMQAIIERITAITQDPDNINKEFNNVKQLQADFKAVGPVPAEATTEIWKKYQLAVEQFYDLLKMNKELRDYDFKKNLEIKQQLCLEAEKLSEQDNVVEAFKRLQILHDTWRETGPVAKEIREEIWARFKAASAVVNKAYQSHFEKQRAAERENAQAKTALCEQIESINLEQIKNYSAWDKATKEILDLQARWKEIGFASRKQNTALFTRFRESCDKFFAQKAEFYKRVKAEFSANLAKKIALCEQAEALKDSTDWKATADKLVALQKEWKTVGTVAKKHSDAVWKRFSQACDYFFEQRKKNVPNTFAIERENLKAKKEVIAQLSSALEHDDKVEAVAQVKELIAKYQEIGHVPFKEKDKLYAEYRAVVDKAYDQLDMRGAKQQLEKFENSIKQISGSDKVHQERERLVRVYENKKSELKTYENNLGFFSAKTASGNTLFREIERKMAKLKDDIAQLEKKIQVIDEVETAE